MSEETLESKLAAMEAYALEVTKALTGLSGGGSEMFSGKIGNIFKADISKCAQVIHDRHAKTHDFLVKAIKEKNDANKQLDALVEALELLDRAKASIEEAYACWNKPDKPGLWPSRASVLIDQIAAYRNREGNSNATL